ncbi:hypothetical protein GGS20DRAFT_583076 [Poronia punctata]|nr:hypothetical protein GGS20DRAFT_583076 [Poronia punctata]
MKVIPGSTSDRLAGCIKWLPKEEELRTPEPGIEKGCYNHPALVLSSRAIKGRVEILVITSFKGIDLAKRLPPDKRSEYLPITPSQKHPDNGILLVLDDVSQGLRKPSYVGLKNKYSIALASLRPYHHHHRVGPELRLSKRSYKVLVQRCRFTEPALLHSSPRVGFTPEQVRQILERVGNAPSISVSRAERLLLPPTTTTTTYSAITERAQPLGVPAPRIFSWVCAESLPSLPTPRREPQLPAPKTVDYARVERLPSLSTTTLPNPKTVTVRYARAETETGPLFPTRESRTDALDRYKNEYLEPIRNLPSAVPSSWDPLADTTPGTLLPTRKTVGFARSEREPLLPTHRPIPTDHTRASYGSWVAVVLVLMVLFVAVVYLIYVYIPPAWKEFGDFLR